MIDLIQGKYEVVKNYYEVSKATDYFEFQFAYTSSDSQFRELDRFVWESRHDKTRFKNKYRGHILIDVTQWNNRGTNKYFEAFMYYLKDNAYESCTLFSETVLTSEFVESLKYVFEINITELETCKVKEKRTIGFNYSKETDENVRS